MRILYIFPHPDDESFGPGPAICAQLREGHEVFLLTLTRGGATKQRFKYNYSVEEMGEVRYGEMLCVEKTLELTGMNVLDFPDSGLKEMLPGELEQAIKQHIDKIKPSVIVTYPVHGISGFHDHLVAHSVVKNVFSRMQKENSYLKRLAFYTINEGMAQKATWLPKINYSTESEIDCIVTARHQDIEKALRALDCYKTYRETINYSNIKNLLTAEVCFEIFREEFNPPITDLFNNLPYAE